MLSLLANFCTLKKLHSVPSPVTYIVTTVPFPARASSHWPRRLCFSHCGATSAWRVGSTSAVEIHPRSPTSTSGFNEQDTHFLRCQTMSNILYWRDEGRVNEQKCWYDFIRFQCVCSTTTVRYCWTDAEKHEVTLPPIQSWAQMVQLPHSTMCYNIITIYQHETFWSWVVEPHPIVNQ